MTAINDVRNYERQRSFRPSRLQRVLTAEEEELLEFSSISSASPAQQEQPSPQMLSKRKKNNVTLSGKKPSSGAKDETIYIRALFTAIHTAIPDNVRADLLENSLQEICFLVALCPRLCSFTERRRHSLRHPALALAAKRLYWLREAQEALREIEEHEVTKTKEHLFVSKQKENTFSENISQGQTDLEQCDNKELNHEYMTEHHSNGLNDAQTHKYAQLKQFVTVTSGYDNGWSDFYLNFSNALRSYRHYFCQDKEIEKFMINGGESSHVISCSTTLEYKPKVNGMENANDISISKSFRDPFAQFRIGQDKTVKNVVGDKRESVNVERNELQKSGLKSDNDQILEENNNNNLPHRYRSEYKNANAADKVMENNLNKECNDQYCINANSRVSHSKEDCEISYNNFQLDNSENDSKSLKNTLSHNMLCTNEQHSNIRIFLTRSNYKLYTRAKKCLLRLAIHKNILLCRFATIRNNLLNNYNNFSVTDMSSCCSAEKYNLHGERNENEHTPLPAILSMSKFNRNVAVINGQNDNDKIMHDNYHSYKMNNRFAKNNNCVIQSQQEYGNGDKVYRNINSLANNYSNDVETEDAMVLLDYQDYEEERWEQIGNCYNAMLNEVHKLRSYFAQTVAQNALINDIIRRFWTRLTVLPSECNEHLHCKVRNKHYSKTESIKEPAAGNNKSSSTEKTTSERDGKYGKDKNDGKKTNSKERKNTIKREKANTFTVNKNNTTFITEIESIETKTAGKVNSTTKNVNEKNSTKTFLQKSSIAGATFKTDFSFLPAVEKKKLSKKEYERSVKSAQVFMTPMQYVYLNLRIAEVLLPHTENNHSNEMQIEMLTSIREDLMIDASYIDSWSIITEEDNNQNMSKQKFNRVRTHRKSILSFGAAPTLFTADGIPLPTLSPWNAEKQDNMYNEPKERGHLVSDELHYESVKSRVLNDKLEHTNEFIGLSSNKELSKNITNEKCSFDNYDEMNDKWNRNSVSTMSSDENSNYSNTSANDKYKFFNKRYQGNTYRNRTNIWSSKCKLEELPSLSFAQFWHSMLVLADNWTCGVGSRQTVSEYVVFLIELYAEVFAHDWTAEDELLLEEIRKSSLIQHMTEEQNNKLTSLTHELLETSANEMKNVANTQETILNAFSQMAHELAEYTSSDSDDDFLSQEVEFNNTVDGESKKEFERRRKEWKRKCKQKRREWLGETLFSSSSLDMSLLSASSTSSKSLHSKSDILHLRKSEDMESSTASHHQHHSNDDIKNSVEKLNEPVQLIDEAQWALFKELCSKNVDDDGWEYFDRTTSNGEVTHFRRKVIMINHNGQVILPPHRLSISWSKLMSQHSLTCVKKEELKNRESSNFIIDEQEEKERVGERNEELAERKVESRSRRRRRRSNSSREGRRSSVYRESKTNVNYSNSKITTDSVYRGKEKRKSNLSEYELPANNLSEAALERTLSLTLSCSSFDNIEKKCYKRSSHNVSTNDDRVIKTDVFDEESDKFQRNSNVIPKFVYVIHLIEQELDHDGGVVSTRHLHIKRRLTQKEKMQRLNEAFVHKTHILVKSKEGKEELLQEPKHTAWENASEDEMLYITASELSLVDSDSNISEDDKEHNERINTRRSQKYARRRVQYDALPAKLRRLEDRVRKDDYVEDECLSESTSWSSFSFRSFEDDRFSDIAFDDMITSEPDANKHMFHENNRKRQRVQRHGLRDKMRRHYREPSAYYNTNNAFSSDPENCIERSTDASMISDNKHNSMYVMEGYEDYSASECESVDILSKEREAREAQLEENERAKRISDKQYDKTFDQVDTKYDECLPLTTEQLAELLKKKEWLQTTMSEKGIPLTDAMFADESKRSLLFRLLRTVEGKERAKMQHVSNQIDREGKVVKNTNAENEDNDDFGIAGYDAELLTKLFENTEFSLEDLQHSELMKRLLGDSMSSSPKELTPAQVNRIFAALEHYKDSDAKPEMLTVGERHRREKMLEEAIRKEQERLIENAKFRKERQAREEHDGNTEIDSKLKENNKENNELLDAESILQAETKQKRLGYNKKKVLEQTRNNDENVAISGEPAPVYSINSLHRRNFPSSRLNENGKDSPLYRSEWDHMNRFHLAEEMNGDSRNSMMLPSNLTVEERIRQEKLYKEFEEYCRIQERNNFKFKQDVEMNETTIKYTEEQLAAFFAHLHLGSKDKTLLRGRAPLAGATSLIGGGVFHQSMECTSEWKNTASYRLVFELGNTRARLVHHLTSHPLPPQPPSASSSLSARSRAYMESSRTRNNKHRGIFHVKGADNEDENGQTKYFLPAPVKLFTLTTKYNINKAIDESYWNYVSDRDYQRTLLPKIKTSLEQGKEKLLERA